MAMLSALLVASSPAVAEETVSFPSLDGPVTGAKPTMLRALLMKPDGPGPFPAIVALHGCGGYSGGFTPDASCSCCSC